MPLLEKATKKKRSRIYRYRVRFLWITLIVLGSMTILGTILLASMDNYDWLLR
jgi:hypothetical protein